MADTVTYQILDYTALHASRRAGYTGLYWYIRVSTCEILTKQLHLHRSPKSQNQLSLLENYLFLSTRIPHILILSRTARTHILLLSRTLCTVTAEYLYTRYHTAANMDMPQPANASVPRKPPT
jgi:hypothetical protein